MLYLSVRFTHYIQPMKIQYCSDLHLEMPDNEKYIKRHWLEPVGEVLVLAGDILPFGLHKEQTEFIDYIADHLRWCIMCPAIMSIMEWMRLQWLIPCWKNYAAMYGW